MSLPVCLPGLVAEGAITQDQADQAAALFGELARDYRRQFGDQAAEAMASEATLKAMERTAARQRYLAGLKIQARKQMMMNLTGSGAPGGGGAGGGGGGPINPALGPAFFARRNGSGMMNVQGRRQAIERRAFSMFAETLQRFHTDALGRMRNAAELGDVVREIFGQATGNANARGMADGWLRAAEMLRQRFNAAGGAIGTLGNGRGYLPQSHDPMKIRQVDYADWRAAVWNGLDRAAMIDERTGLPFSDQALEPVLFEVWQTLRSDGWLKRSPGSQAGKGATANQRADPRFLVFKDADSWMAYNEAFGTGDPFKAMIGHVRGMARDIAAMERFGPNPEAGVQWLRDTIMQSAQLAPDKGEAIGRAESELLRMEALWDEYNGASSVPGKRWLSNVGRAVRAYETARSLGSAIITAVPGDIGNQHRAARFNALPTTQVLANQIKLLNPADPAHRLLAAKMGLTMEAWTGHMAAASRLGVDEMAAGAMGQVAETVLRSSGLSVWTDTGIAAFGQTVLGHMADVRALPFDQLDAGFRDMLVRGRIGAADWDAIRATPVRTEQGAEWIFAQDIADTDLGDRVLAMIADESNIAVIQRDFETSAVMRHGLRSGTVKGEVAQTALLFKSFGISTLINHGRRMMSLPTAKARMGYALNVAITLTLMGAVSLQLKEIAKGRDPKPMDDPRFWGAAALQGGGFGMLGDLMGLVANPRLGAWGEWFLGPVATTLKNTSAVIGKTGQHLAYEAGLADKDANAGGAVVRALREQLPGGNLWYLRTALNRMLIDQLQEQIDPDYRKSWRAMERAAQKDGTDFFWAPGEAMPERAPDLSNAIEGETRP